MSEETQKIVRALMKSRAEQETESKLQSLQRKVHAIKKAEGAILAAIGSWTGQKVGAGEPIPVFRNGEQVGSVPRTTLSGDPLAKISSASLIEHKKEIERRKAQLKDVLEHAEGLIKALDTMAYPERLELQRSSETGKINALNSLNLPLDVRIVEEIGHGRCAIISAAALASASKREVEKLEEELEMRKAKRGRPRNQATHAVAKELALLYATVTGKRPTYSAGPDGLSGEFTPVLREVFDCLGWGKTDLRGPAEKAIEAISDADLRYEEIKPFGSFFTLGAE